MAAEVIHKLNITAEAAFDISECFCLEQLNKRELKTEVEEYITLLSVSERLPWWGYFRVDYEDEISGERLKLFIYKGVRIGIMQYWDLKGVCISSDWTQESEDDGQVRAWVETPIEKIPDEDDCVVRVRVREIIQNTEKTLWENVLEEVLNGFECERDQEAAKRMAFLQSVFFDNGGRRVVKAKDRGGRKKRRKP